MTRPAENVAERARIFSPQAQATPAASKSKRKWLCFCPSEPAAKPAKQDKALYHKPATHKAVAPPLSSGEAGSAPRVEPVPAFGAFSDDGAFPSSRDVIDLTYYR